MGSLPGWFFTFHGPCQPQACLGCASWWECHRVWGRLANGFGPRARRKKRPGSLPPPPALRPAAATRLGRSLGTASAPGTGLLLLTLTPSLSSQELTQSHAPSHQLCGAVLSTGTRRVHTHTHTHTNTHKHTHAHCGSDAWHPRGAQAESPFWGWKEVGEGVLETPLPGVDAEPERARTSSVLTLIMGSVVIRLNTMAGCSPLRGGRSEAQQARHRLGPGGRRGREEAAASRSSSSKTEASLSPKLTEGVGGGWEEPLSMGVRPERAQRPWPPPTVPGQGCMGCGGIKARSPSQRPNARPGWSVCGGWGG